MMMNRIRCRWNALAAIASVCGIVIVVIAGPVPASAQTVVDEWDSVKAPPPPPLKPVNVDPGTTALLVMDFNERACNMRDRCRAAIPKLQKLIAAARARRMMIVYSYSPNMKKADILKAVEPASGDHIIQALGDKFWGTDLDQTLRAKGIKTIITTGSQASGTVLFTAFGGALRGYKAIVPIDVMPAATAYQEQFTMWEVADGPGLRENATLTRSDMITLNSY